MSEFMYNLAMKSLQKEKRKLTTIKKCECECICGNKLTITYNKLINSKVRDCGCRKRSGL